MSGTKSEWTRVLADDATLKLDVNKTDFCRDNIGIKNKVEPDVKYDNFSALLKKM